MVHSAHSAVLVLCLIKGACGVQRQKIMQHQTLYTLSGDPYVELAALGGSVVGKQIANALAARNSTIGPVPGGKLGDAVMPAVTTGLWAGGGVGALRSLWLGWQHCMTTKILEDKIKKCNQGVIDCTNKTTKNEELCKADLWNDGASGCQGAWEVERGWMNHPGTRLCYGPYEVTKRALATAIWAGVGAVPGFLVGTIQFFDENLKACKAAFDLEDAARNNTDFDYNDFVSFQWYVQKMLHEEPSGETGRCRKMDWDRRAFGQVRERTLTYKAFREIEVPQSPPGPPGSSTIENLEMDIDKTRYRRCLNYPDPSQHGVMTYGGCWTDGQTTDYFVPYYNKTKGLAIVFQGQPSIMNKDGKCLYAKSKNKDVGYTFGRGQADDHPKYRKYEKSFWILSRAKTVAAADMTALLKLIEIVYNIDIKRLQTIDNSGSDC